MERRLEVGVIRDTQTFAALQTEWEELYHNCLPATPFQSWSWFYPWWESLGEGYELRLITVRHEGLLVGLIPLMLKRRLGFGALRFIGHHGFVSSYPDILVREGWDAKVSEAGRHALRQMDSWHVTNLSGLSPMAAAWSIFRDWDGPRTCVQISNYDVLDVKPWDELVASLSKNHRSTSRRTLRRAKEDEVRWVLAGTEDAERAARRLVALHREMLQGRGILPERLTEEWESLMVAAARRMTDRGLGGISECWRDGEVIVSWFFAFGSTITYVFQLGANGEAMRRYQWSSLFIWDALNIARSRNSSYLYLGSGEEPYKQRWAPRKIPCYQMFLYRGPALWALYMLYRSIRAGFETKLERHMESDSTPKWIQSAATGLRGRLRT
jgi:CelD/BcsL family acetyltransferase involved in cellulose biosynthesis